MAKNESAIGRNSTSKLLMPTASARLFYPILSVEFPLALQNIVGLMLLGELNTFYPAVVVAVSTEEDVKRSSCDFRGNVCHIKY